MLLKIKTSEILLATASGVIRSREARISNLSVESFEYQDLIFGEGNWSYLGLSFLSRHIVTFDFPNSRMYLKKGKEFNYLIAVMMAGMLIEQNKKKNASNTKQKYCHECGTQLLK